MRSRLPELRSLSPLRRLAQLSWLSLLLVLALSPAAIAGSTGSSGLAVLLRELLCGCSTCAGELEAAPAPQGCCEREAAPARESECGGTSGCTCTHPDEVPLGESTPLARPGDARRDLLLAAELRGDGQPESCVAAEHPSAPVTSRLHCRPPPDGWTSATHGRRLRATGDRLAWLATYLI